MSGGSYHHLWSQLDTCDQINFWDLESMRNRLNELAPGSAAARDTAALHAYLAALRGYSALTQVWHDIEWFDSNDYSEDQARERIKEYEQAHHNDKE